MMVYVEAFACQKRFVLRSFSEAEKEGLLIKAYANYRRPKGSNLYSYFYRN